MWLSEVMTEKGIGNGASILIFVGIISQLPFYIKNTAQLIASGVSVTGVVAMVATLLVMILAIVYVQEAQGVFKFNTLNVLLDERCMAVKIPIFQCV